MREIVEFLDANPNGFLATLEGGEPRVRPYQFMLEDGGRLCFSTNNTKEVCKQLKAAPAMEFSASNPAGGWIRLRGSVKFTAEARIKQRILERSEVVRSLYGSVDNAMFEVFYLDHGSAQIMPAAGRPVSKVEF